MLTLFCSIVAVTIYYKMKKFLSFIDISSKLRMIIDLAKRWN